MSISTLMNPRRAVVSALAGAALLAGCGGGTRTDKAGGARPDPARVLTIATSNGDLGELQRWADEVARLSKGRLKLKPDGPWREGEIHYETGLIADVRAGKADLGWVGSRAWSQQGVHELDALHAPFIVSDYRLEEAVLRDPVTDRMLAAVDHAGVKGIAILPGPMRFLLTRRPVTKATDLRGQTIAINESGVAAATFRALGAHVRLFPSGGKLGSSDGVEQQLASISGNAYAKQAPDLAVDAPLYPRPFVVFANQGVWKQLEPTEREVLRTAAERAVEPMIEQSKADDAKGFASVCDLGGRPVPAPADALRLAVEPVYQEVRRNPVARDVMDLVERERTKSPPEPITPMTCPHKAEPTGGLPVGTYEVTLRAEDPGADSVGLAKGDPSVHMILRVTHRRAHIDEPAPGGGTETGFDESYSVYRDRVRFAGEGGVPFTASWRLDGRRLVFTDIQGKPDDKFVWGSHPWVRTGG
jgi:TRAP-type C4-dicarboxylate transport system substrate-binding protein